MKSRTFDGFNRYRVINSDYQTTVSDKDKILVSENERLNLFAKKVAKQALEKGDIVCNRDDILNYLRVTFDIQLALDVVDDWMKEWFVKYPST